MTYFHCRLDILSQAACKESQPLPPLGGSDNDGTGWGVNLSKPETGGRAVALTRGVMHMMDLIIRLTVGTESFPVSSC